MPGLGPRLNHKKARTGCMRCKARKVKCDETRPKCSACERHDVECSYIQHSPQPPPQQRPLPEPALDSSTTPSDNGLASEKPDHMVELRLMHEWTAYACKSISTAWEYWRYQAPLVALQYRYAMDALLALSALHSSRQPRQQQMHIQGHIVPLRDPVYRVSLNVDPTKRWKMDPYKASPVEAAESPDNDHEQDENAQKRSRDMLLLSRMYFDRAIEGHRKALTNLTVENIESVYLTSVIVSYIALFTLYDADDDTSMPMLDPIMWVRLANGTRMICNQWARLVGPGWMTTSGAFYGKPDLADGDELFRVEHCEPFRPLLTFGQEYENLSEEDQDVYQKVLSYIGVMHKGIVDGSEPPLASCRRLIALPARAPLRFIELIEQKQPRATVILAYGFAMMKLIEDKVQWFKGVAERQIPRIQEELPPKWREMMKWPMAVASGEIDAETALSRFWPS